MGNIPRVTHGWVPEDFLSQIENALLRGAHIKNSYRLFQNKHDEIFGTLPNQFGNQDLGAIIKSLQRNIMARRIIPNHVQYVYALKFSSDVKFAESTIQPMVNRIGFQATSRKTTNWSLAKVEQLLVRASRLRIKRLMSLNEVLRT